MITPDGSLKIAVAGVHTHELWIGPDDALYGEDVTNVGDNFRHRVWKRTSDGQISHKIDWRDGHPVDYNDYGFAFDKAGLMYVLNRNDKRIQIYNNPLTEKQHLERTLSFADVEGFVHWHTVHQDGTVYITVGNALIRFDSNSNDVITMAEGLIERTPAFDFLHDRHALMGLWTDEHKNVYVSIYAGQQVKRITPEGHTSTVYTQSDEWSIAGGIVDLKGETWLFEFSSGNKARVRHIDDNGEHYWGD